jgi:2-keto-3-deoxy-galactonokinase
MKHYITIDGGTTNTRISLVTNGSVIETKKFPIGAKDCTHGVEAFKRKITEEIDNICLHNSLATREIEAVIASGMITSSYGLYNLDHIDAPAGIPELHEGMMRVENVFGTLPCHFIPGVKKPTDDPFTADMMRGEETEIFGLTGEYNCENTTFVLPGSHSKHIFIDSKRRISDFKTLLTGEAIFAIANDTILKDAVSLDVREFDKNALLSGYEAAEKSGLYEALFKVRIKKALFNKNKEECYSFFLGVMLMEEVSSIRRSSVKRVVIGGKPELREPLAYLLRCKTTVDVIALTDKECENATALGAVLIYEYKSLNLNEDTAKVIEESIRGFGHDNAKEPCSVRYYPTDSRFTEAEVRYQGCPTVALTRGGRVFVGWYGGGVKEPSLEHFNIVKYSDDGGKSFSPPLLVIESDEKRMVHALDIQLWTAPNGALWLFWVQNNATTFTDDKEYMMTANTVDKLPVVKADGYVFPDMRHTCWCIVCDNPDAEKPVFSNPRLLDIGFLRCKPLVLDDGRWLFFNYDQLTDRYGYTISDDEGKTFTRHYGAEKLCTSYDESMAYQRLDGSVRMLSRNRLRDIAESVSYDRGLSWSKAKATGIDSPDTRFFISRTPTGRVILINNDMKEQRERLSIWLSDDDGESWKYKKLVDNPAHHLTYPDADFYDGKIYLVYDRGRRFENEIHLLVFTEEDVMDPSTDILISETVSKPKNPGIGDLPS